MAEDMRISDLTQISDTPANGVLPIEVQGSTQANGITVENLLKEVLQNKNKSSSDLNTLTASGIYMVNVDAANSYFNYCILMVINRYYCAQIEFNVLSSQIAFRTSKDDGITWNDWKIL